jgi:RecA-family ATPase
MTSRHPEQEEIKARYRRAGANGEDQVDAERKIELVHFADMEARLNGRPLVKGILEREQISIVFGEPGCGKTFLALDLALHVAAGLPWVDRAVFAGAAVYAAAEAGRGIVNRVAAFKQLKSAGDAVPFAAITSPIDLCHADTNDVERLIEAIWAAQLVPLRLLVIDTVSRALAGGNENAPDDMGALVRSLDQLRHALACHVLAVHHAGKDLARGSRGHSLLRCAVDTEIESSATRPASRPPP